MSTLQEAEEIVSRLSPKDLAAFRAWFVQFDTELWDRQFEKDVAVDRLDGLAEKALQHLQQGRCTDQQLCRR